MPKRRKGQMPHLKQRCFRCRGTGRAPCAICGGTGRVANGTDPFGQPRFEGCSGCFGSRQGRCPNCNGEGLA